MDRDKTLFDYRDLLEFRLNNFNNLYCYENKNNNEVVNSYCEYYSPDLYNYQYNTFGFRSVEFSSKIDILTAGCSHTFGTGLPFEYTWSQQLQSMIPNHQIATIAWPGYSVQKIISMIFKYCKNIGNPKMIICNFPDFYRMLFLLKDSYKIIGYYPNIGENYSYDKIKKKEILKSLPSEYWGFYISYDYILMLEQYCDSNNIKLIWSTWFDGTSKGKSYNLDINNFVNDFQENLKNNFNHYYYDSQSSFDLFFGSLGVDPSEELINCHQKLKEKTKDFFEIAYDRYIVPDRDRDNFQKHLEMSRLEKDKNLNTNLFAMGHFGSHRNAHWAEFYYNIIKENYPEFI